MTSSQNLVLGLAFAALIVAALYAAGPEHVMTGFIVGAKTGGTQKTANFALVSEKIAFDPFVIATTDACKGNAALWTQDIKPKIHFSDKSGNLYAFLQYSQNAENDQISCFKKLDINSRNIQLSQLGITESDYNAWVTSKTVPTGQSALAAEPASPVAPPSAQLPAVAPAAIDKPSTGAGGAGVSADVRAYAGSGAGAAVSSQLQTSPSTVSIAGMTLYNLNKWPVGFANPEGGEKGFKDFVEENIKGKYYPTENGLPPKATEGVTVSVAYPKTSTSYSLLQLSGTTLNAYTGCEDPTVERTVAGSTSATTAKAASCESQTKITAELLAYVLDEGRTFTLPQGCKLAQPNEQTACAVCGGSATGTPTCPIPRTAGATGPTGPTAGVSSPDQLTPAAKEKAKSQGADLTCVGTKKVNVVVSPGSFNDKGGDLALKIKLNEKTVKLVESGTPELVPSVYLSVVLYPVKNLNAGKLKADKKTPEEPNWVPSYPAALWRKYCINPDGFGELETTLKNKDACSKLETNLKKGSTHKIYASLTNALKADSDLSLSLSGNLLISVKGMKGTIPSPKPSPKPSGQKVSATAPDLLTVNTPDLLACNTVSVPATEVIASPFAPLVLSEEVASTILFDEAAGTGAATSAATGATATGAKASSASAFNYYTFSGKDKDGNPASFTVKFGQAVGVKVFLRQWYDRDLETETQPTQPPEKQKIYCSTPLDKDLNDLGARPMLAGKEKHFDVTGLEEFKKADTPPVKVPPRAKAVGTGGGTQGQSGAGTGGAGRGGGAIPNDCVDLYGGRGYACRAVSECADYQIQHNHCGNGALKCCLKKDAYIQSPPPVSGSVVCSSYTADRCPPACEVKSGTRRCVVNPANTAGYQTECTRSSRGPCTPDRCNAGGSQMYGDAGPCCVWQDQRWCGNKA